ncbi:MAG: OmpA family protein [Bacteroidetes bacterium]|nr:OmpA family protein [Bacteroidota bacterium]
MKPIIRLLVISICLLSISIASGQINVGSRLENKVNDRINNKIDKGIDKGLDGVENGVKSDDNSAKTQSEETQTANQSNDEGAGQQDVKPDGKQDKPGMQTYSKYDFVPGAKVLFYDDFSEAAVGDFPANWNTNTSGEVVTTNLFPGNWFKMIGEGSVALDEGLNLPDNYTIEFDVISHPSGKDNENANFGFYLYSASNPKDLNEGGAVPGKVGIKMEFGYRSSYSAYDETGYTLEGTKDEAAMIPDNVYRLSFWVQKTRLRVYLNQDKIFDLPKVMTAGYQYNMMRFELWDAGEPMITNFRVAAGLPDMRNKLITEGKLVSYGIYFDVNKDVVKPESYGTLKGIADVLKENPAVRVKIVGYTDSDGADAANLDLSKRRGASVKSELVKNFGIDASRLESDGMGETKPVAPNDTPVNKAMNRRVEFIKL